MSNISKHSTCKKKSITVNFLFFFWNWFISFLDIAEQLGGPIENDIYGPSHRFGSRNNVSRVVQGDDWPLFIQYDNL